MKKFLLFFIGILFSGLAFADGISVKVVDKITDATGTDTYVYNKADGKIYAYNTKGEYELYGEYTKVNTLKTAGADQEIEYIETTTTMQSFPYINTGYIFKQNTRIVVDCEIADNDIRAYEAVFGARSGITRDAFIFFWRFGGNNAGCFAVNTREERGDELMVMPTDERITIDAQGSTVDVFTADDPYTPYLSITNEMEQVEEGNREMYIFDLNNNNAADNSVTPMKLYGFQIYEGDVLVMDLVPVVSGDGRSGLKDKVSGRKFFSPNGVNFEVSPDGEEALGGAGITAYEGKLVCLTTNNHEYKYTNGDWVDCGMMALEPIADDEYKDMTTWKYPESKADCFANVFYDDSRDLNELAPYHGTAYWEPFVHEIATEPNETYNFSFDYESEAWGSWTNRFMRACIASSIPAGGVGTNNYYTNGDGMSDHDTTFGAIASAELPRTDTTGDPQHISVDFMATQDHHYLLFNFGLVQDDADIYFAFANLQVSKYVYAETYSFAPQLAAQVALAQDFLTTAKTTNALQNQINAEIAKAQNLLASGTNNQQRDEYYDFLKVFDKVKANNFADDVWTKTMALAKKENVNVAAYEAYLNTGTESTYADQLQGLRMARMANAIETGEFTTGQPAAEGDYYLYNVGTKNFLVGGSDWGAHAAIGWPGIVITLEAPEEGEGFYVNTHLYNCDFANSEYGSLAGTEEENQGHYMGPGGYLDNGRFAWQFVPVAGKPNVYNICKSRTNEETGEVEYFDYLGYNPFGRTDAGYWPCYNTVCSYETDPAAATNQWLLITREQRDDLVATATADKPADLSYLIAMPNFSQREYANGDEGWRMVWTSLYGGGLSGRGGRIQDQNGDLAYDAYELDAGPLIYQENITVPATGYYGVSATALCRPGILAEMVSLINSGDKPLYESVLFTNNNEKLLPLFSEEADKAPGMGRATAIGEIPAVHTEAIKYFENGLYKVEVIEHLNANQTLFFGIEQKESGVGNQYWIMADNFRLKYYGTTDPTTGIENIPTANIETLNDGKYYTIQGIAVDRPTKRGIYIRNGRKVILK